MLSKSQLYNLRNNISINFLIESELDIAYKYRENQIQFICPICSDFYTATNPKTNLARCFRCKVNFNPIDLVIAVNRCSFKQATNYLMKFINN